ncbi:D-aminoacylase [Myxococcota bacterium]|nr:D-aminoacylase [Myxococcota bacterium]
MAHDLVIRAGTLIDGTGEERTTGDIAIDDGRLSQVGGAAGPGRREIDASGLVVSPGFIDPHTHYDAQIWWDAELTPSCWHGITSVVMGNCGFTIAPCRPDGRQRVAKMLERVEGMSLPALEQGIEWQWETFPEFLDAIENRRPALNVGSCIGHSALRYYVMDGEATERQATPAEVEQMRVLVREAMRAGALGFSTSQAPTHVGGDGKPVPSRFATDEEVLTLVEVMNEFEHGAFEIVVKDLNDVQVSIEAAQRSGRPVTFLGLPTQDGRRDLENARSDGLELVPQTTCRPTLMDFTLAGGVVFDQLECWADLMNVSRDEMSRILSESSFRERFREEISGKDGRFTVFQPRWHDIHVTMTGKESLRENIGRSIAEIATVRGIDPLNAFFDLPLEDDLATEFSYQLSTDLDKTDQVLGDEHLLGLSDAGAHLTLLSDAAYTTYFLGQWVRERRQISLEQAIHKMTQQPAQFWGIRERGLLREGWHADVVTFDPETVSAKEAEVVFDLPGGGGRLLPRAEGIETVIVNGCVTVEDGELTGERAGQVLRGS